MKNTNNSLGPSSSFTTNLSACLFLFLGLSLGLGACGQQVGKNQHDLPLAKSEPQEPLTTFTPDPVPTPQDDELTYAQNTFDHLYQTVEQARQKASTARQTWSKCLIKLQKNHTITVYSESDIRPNFWYTRYFKKSCAIPDFLNLESSVKILLKILELSEQELNEMHHLLNQPQQAYVKKLGLDYQDVYATLDFIVALRYNWRDYIKNYQKD